MARVTSLVIIVLLGPISVAAGQAPATRPEGASKVVAKPVDPKSATLTEALADWVALLELDYALAPERAAARWAKDDAAAKALKENWAALVERHAEFDYERWVKGDGSPAATHLPADATAFARGVVRR